MKQATCISLGKTQVIGWLICGNLQALIGTQKLLQHNNFRQSYLNPVAGFVFLITTLFFPSLNTHGTTKEDTET